MKRIYIPLLIALTFSACQDNIAEPEAAVHDNVMRFNLVGPDVQTKVSSGAFEASDQIGLYVTDYVNETTPMPLQISGNRANNFQVTFDGAAWTPEQTIYWGNGKSDVYAYYPYFGAITDVNNLYFEVATDQTTDGYEASDFLWAKAEGVSQTDGAVNLEMKHLMSKLTMKIVAGEDYIGSLPEDATVQLHSTVTNVNIDLENGSVVKDPYSGAKSIKMRKLGIRTFDGVDAVVYEAIVVPQMLENSVPLLEINSKSVSYLLEDPFNFRPGVAYTYTATLNTSTTAIKVEIGCELEDWNSTGDSSGEGGDTGEGGSGEEGDDVEYTDLSVEGTANCYLIQGAGNYRFKSVIGNSDATVGNVKSVEVLWESFGTDEMPNVGDLIASVSYKDGYIRFSTPETFKEGNAVIAAKNSKGVILWSWHIWLTDKPADQVYYNNAGTMMDRNLGATSATPGDVGALGLLYQWGRKDPFLGSSTISDNVVAQSTVTWPEPAGSSDNQLASVQKELPYLAEKNPTTFYVYYYAPKDSWNLEKTIYDPCPVGYRVPDGGSEGVWATAEGGSYDGHYSYTDHFEANMDYTNNGINFSNIFADDSVIWYPAAGFRHDDIGFLDRVGHTCNCWSVYSDPIDYGVAYCLSTDYIYVYPLARTGQSSGRSVRCQKITD